MFIHSGRPAAADGSINSLSNIDYYKRYILIDIPDIITDNNVDIIVINNSSETGRSFMGVFDYRTRCQSTNIYHCRGNPLKSIPTVIDNNITDYINYDSIIKVIDASYGSHLYDMRKQRFGELETHTSYNDLFNKSRAMNNIPYILFYNIEHHLLNEELNKVEYPTCQVFVENRLDISSNSYYIRMKELIDDKTVILVSKSSNFSDTKFNDSDYIDLDNLTILTIGPLTDFLTGMMFNEASFCYDSCGKLSDVKYRTDHIMPNELYWSQIKGNYISSFISDMENLSDYANGNFRMFVYYRLSNIKLKFIKYHSNGSSIVKNFSYDIGENRNCQHIHTHEWATIFYG